MDSLFEQPQGRFALVNGRVVLPEEVVVNQALVIGAGEIFGLGETDSLGSEVERVDVGGRLIAPGLVDIHTHGALGHSFNEPTSEAFAAITAENARRGVTLLLATLAAAPIPDLCGCLEFCRRWMADTHDGAQIAGVHLESPYISMAQRGALSPQSVRTPDDGTPERLLEHNDVLRIFVLAPELPGALDLVARLARLGVVPAAGHSSAKDEQVLAAMKVGLRHVTHIWSAMSSTIREGPWRKPGLLEAALVFDGLTVEMIADSKHLPTTLMKLAYRCIEADRLCAISDATSGAGLPEGTHFRMGDMEYDVHDGVGMMLDRTAFAGSTTLLNQMVPILTDAVGIPLAEAIRMATLTPARAIDLDDRKGSLEVGKDADLAVFDDDFTAWRTMIGGRWVYVA
jgi:N-acetylglucosamine-6-phosphate deacetylase